MIVAQFFRQRFQLVTAAGDQHQVVTITRASRAANAAPIPDEAPVITACGRASGSVAIQFTP